MNIKISVSVCVQKTVSFKIDEKYANQSSEAKIIILNTVSKIDWKEMTVIKRGNVKELSEPK